jgi:hypothetical protein
MVNVLVGESEDHVKDLGIDVRYNIKINHYDTGRKDWTLDRVQWGFS